MTEITTYQQDKINDQRVIIIEGKKFEYRPGFGRRTKRLPDIDPDEETLRDYYDNLNLHNNF